MSVTGITINVFMPLVMGGAWIRNITTIQSNYSHSISAFGGYDMASFNVDTNVTDLEDWLENGLMRHIVVYDEAQNVMWEGFVNRVSVSYGPLVISRGPALDIANRVKVVYSTVDTSITPPAVGVRTSTAVTNDTTSQTRYGIFQATLSAGGATAANALQIRNTYIAEHRNPSTTTSLSLAESRTVSVNVECLGYQYLLNYIYTNTSTGTSTASAKITAILAANPNASTVPFSVLGLSANSLAVPTYENDDTKAMEIIKGIVALGDSSDNRWLFGIYAGRTASYNIAPSDVSYVQRVTTQEIVTETASGVKVFPWNVLPGKWMFVPDFLIGKPQPSIKREDPRFIFIESVTYTAPYGLSIQGGTTDKLPQKLAKFGLAGVSA